MNLVGELVINKTRLEQIHNAGDGASLNETIEQVGRITTDLQDIVMYVRMVPIEQVFNRFPRMVRDLSRDLGKEINFIMEGKETELDRTVIDEIGDPLVHLIRHSLDHGVKTVMKSKSR
jgi:two-component system chemotaxis sensor kinase CheA